MGEKHKIKALFDRYRKGVATEEEKHTIASWFEQLDALDKPLPEERVEHYATRSMTQLRKGQLKGKKIHWIYWTAAASLIAGILTVSQYLPVKKEMLTAAIDRSMLRFSDGREIYLDTTSDSTITLSDGISIHITGSEIHYLNKEISSSEAIKHTLITSRKKQYEVVLQDGSHIWLNAGSQLTYPLQFAQTARLTELSGEAYFEVSKAAGWPFIVKVADDQLAIRVLGTAFNVNASAEAIQTTLVSGSVELDTHTESGKTILKPDQKAIYSLRNKHLQILTVDTDKETDWIDNRLVFRETPMKEVLARLSRFYNVEFNVKNNRIYKHVFTGTFQNKPLVQVLNYMQLSSAIQYSITYKQNGKEKKTIVELK